LFSFGQCFSCYRYRLNASDYAFLQLSSLLSGSFFEFFCFDAPLQLTGETVGEVKAVADMHQRKAEMAKHSDAFIALPG